MLFSKDAVFEAGDITTDLLRQAIDHKVSVFCAKSCDRSDFETSISVQGSLEYNSVANQFRVLVSDGIYTYFRTKHVIQVSVRPVVKFQDDSQAVIRLSI